MKIKAILLMVFSLGWVITGRAADYMKGDGRPTSRETFIADYGEIKADDVVGFNHEQSDDPSIVEVTVGQNLHPYVNIGAKDRVLTIAFKGAKVDHFTKFIIKMDPKWLAAAGVSGNANFMVNNPLIGGETVIKANANSLAQLKETVTVGKLGLNVSDNADVIVSHLEADKTECDINGSGSITIKKGNVKEGDYNIVSNGDIHAFGSAVPQLSCKVTSNSLTGVHTIDNLKANVVGKGNIRYKGPTAVQQRIIGKGTVEEIKE